MRRLATGAVTVLLLSVAAFTGYALFAGFGPFPGREGCEAEVADQKVRINLQQAEHVALMSALAEQRELPARAVTIAIATAYQESKIRNLDHGDRDSLGLFQQRPSQGWGTAKQIQDPEHAIGAFYDALVQVPGYRTMEITKAAQEVQRSGFPEAYADHEADARVLASALTGNSKAAFSCTVKGGSDEADQELNARGLVQRAQVLHDDLEETFGGLATGGFAPGGVSTGHSKNSAHYDGRAVDIFVRPINERNKRRGWAIASYLVAHADRLAVKTVIFDGRIWTEGTRSAQGWRDYSPDVGGRSPEAADILEHRDHVHVDVAE